MFLRNSADRLRGRQDHNRSARPPDPPLSHLGNRQRQLPLQGKLSRCGPKKEGSN